MKQYLRRLWRFAFREFGVRTDLWYALISILVSGVTGGKAKPVHEVTTHDVVVYFGIALGMYLLLRVAAAPYFLWREDQNKIAALQAELDLPNRVERSAMKEHAIELRKELSARLARFVGLTQILGNKLPSRLRDDYSDNYLAVFDYKEYLPLQMKITDLLQELSYDPVVRTAGWNLISLCGLIAEKVAVDGPPKDLLERLKTQAKMTFRILHYDNLAGQWGAFAELEAYLTEVGDPILQSSVPERQSP